MPINHSSHPPSALINVSHAHRLSPFPCQWSPGSVATRSFSTSALIKPERCHSKTVTFCLTSTLTNYELRCGTFVALAFGNDQANVRTDARGQERTSAPMKSSPGLELSVDATVAGPLSPSHLNRYLISSTTEICLRLPRAFNCTYLLSKFFITNTCSQSKPQHRRRLQVSAL